MTSKLKTEINAIQGRAAVVKIDSQIMEKLLAYIQIAAYLISKGHIDRAESWLQIAMDSDDELTIFDDLKDSNGNHGDIELWINKRLEGEIRFDESVTLIREQFPELEKLRTA